MPYDQQPMICRRTCYEYLNNSHFLLADKILIEIFSDFALIKALTKSSSGSSAAALKEQRAHEITMQEHAARHAQESQDRNHQFQLANTKAMMEVIAAMKK